MADPLPEKIVNSLIVEGQSILRSLGFSGTQTNEMAALVLLVLAEIKSPNSWNKATNNAFTIRKGIMDSMSNIYDRKYAENTRESVRRQVLHQFVDYGLVEKNHDNPNRPPNSSKNNYRISPWALTGIQFFGEKNKRWEAFVSEFNEFQKDKYKQLHEIREPIHTEVKFFDNDGEEIELKLAPGMHGVLQKKIVYQFSKWWIKEPVILFIDNTGKGKYVNFKKLQELGINLHKHSKAPDVVIYDENEERKWFFLFEAVTSHGPIDNTRMNQLYKIFKNFKDKLIFITVFPSFKEFKDFAQEIAYDTEVWLTEDGLEKHLIHYNGDRFLDPRKI